MNVSFYGSWNIIKRAHSATRCVFFVVVFFFLLSPKDMPEEVVDTAEPRENRRSGSNYFARIGRRVSE